MIKNYTNSSFNEKKNEELTPQKETISFLLNYSKSFSIQKSKMVNHIRFDKN